MPELPSGVRARYAALGLSQYDVLVLADELAVCRYFDAVLAAGAPPKPAANWVQGDVMAAAKELPGGFEALPMAPAALAEMISLIEDGTISGKIGKQARGLGWDGVGCGGVGRTRASALEGSGSLPVGWVGWVVRWVPLLPSAANICTTPAAAQRVLPRPPAPRNRCCLRCWRARAARVAAACVHWWSPKASSRSVTRLRWRPSWTRCWRPTPSSCSSTGRVRARVGGGWGRLRLSWAAGVLCSYCGALPPLMHPSQAPPDPPPDPLPPPRAGKTKLQGFFVGAVMKESKGRANPAELNRILMERLNAPPS